MSTEHSPGARAPGTIARAFALALLLPHLSGCRDADLVAVPAPVVSVVLTAPATRLVVGDSLQLSVVSLDGEGQAVSGVEPSFTSDRESIARVDARGVVTALSEGSVTIRAHAADATGEISLRIDPAPEPSIAVTPAFRALAVGAKVRLLSPAASAWSSTDAAVASVDDEGTVTGAAPGVARIVARDGERADTALVAVLGPASLLSTAFAGGAYRAEAAPGAALAVPVTLDLSALGEEGDLGAVELEVLFDPAVLELIQVTTGLQGASDHHLVEPGKLRFAFAGTAAQVEAELVLAGLEFRVRDDAAPETETALRISFPARPVSTSLEALALPLAVGGRIRVVSP